MQLAGWRNQISNNALLNYLLQSKHAPWKLFLKCFYGCYSNGKDVLALFHCFQDCYCYSNNDVMCHVTKYCNTIGPHCTVRRDKACIRSSPDPSLSCGSGSGLRDYHLNWSCIARTGNWKLRDSPRTTPRFVSQPWRKKSGSGLGPRPEIAISYIAVQNELISNMPQISFCTWPLGNISDTALAQMLYRNYWPCANTITGTYRKITPPRAHKNGRLE